MDDTTEILSRLSPKLSMNSIGQDVKKVRYGNVVREGGGTSIWA